MTNKRFGEGFTEFTSRPHGDDIFLVRSYINKRTYKTKRSELFSNMNVAHTVFQFAKNTSQIAAPSTGWSETPSITTNSEWLWIRQGKITPLTSSLPVWSAPVRVKGETGNSGVYIGATPPTDGSVNIALDPSGDAYGEIPMDDKAGEVLTKITNTANMFTGCYLLEGVSLDKLKVSITFLNSPLLSRACILFLITNSANTTQITVTLHANAKARLTATDIILASSKNITIV